MVSLFIDLNMVILVVFTFEIILCFLIMVMAIDKFMDHCQFTLNFGRNAAQNEHNSCHIQPISCTELCDQNEQLIDDQCQSTKNRHGYKSNIYTPQRLYQRKRSSNNEYKTYCQEISW